MGFPIDLPSGKGMTINYLLCIIALIASTFSTFSRVQNFILTLHSLSEKVELFFFWRKCSTVAAVGVQTSFLQPPAPWKGGTAKSVTEKNNSRVDCAEADKKTVQAQRYEGRGFLAAGDSAPAELAVINYQVKPDRFLSSFLPIS